jgi:hypothetical protein
MMLFGLLVIGGLFYWRMHRHGSRILHGKIWSCGHPHLNARMQYTATSFSQPLRRIFSGVYQPDEHVDKDYGEHPLIIRGISHSVHIGDLAYHKLYIPIRKATHAIANKVAREHARGMHAYLAYIFVTILALLLWVAK